MSTQSPSQPKSPHAARAQKAAKSPKHPNNIRTAIQHSQWNFNQVAEKAKIPRDTLVDYCAGKYAVPHERLQALSEVLNVLPEYLVPPLPNLREAYWSQSQHEETKDLEALLLLRTHCHLHSTDENALQQLMELLGKVGRTREIEKWYERFVQEVKKEDVWREPDADTTALLVQLRARSAHSASEPASAHAGQTAPTSPSSEPKEEVGRPGTGSPIPSPGSGSPTPPSDPNPQTMGISRDTIVIQTSQVQIVVQPSSDEETPSGRTIPSVLVTSPSPNSEQMTSSPSLTVSPQGIIPIGAGANAPSLGVRKLRDSSLALSTDIVPSLKVYSSHCQGEVTTCGQQIDIYETIEQRSTMNDEHIRDLSQITRRDLIMLASVSSSLLLNIRRGWLPAGMIEEFLSEVTASVTTCWYLFRRGDLTTVEHAVPQYLPELEELVKSSSLHRKRAAYLAAQGFLLSSLVSLHRMRNAERVANCQKAVTYASASGDLALLVKSLDNLGDAFLLNEQPEESLQTYLQAEDYSKSTRISGFLRSQVLVQLSQPYAKLGKSEEVRRFLDEAYATFTDADSETPVFLLTDNGRDQTILYEGSSILRLGNHAKDQGKPARAREHWMNAAETFGKMAQLPSGLEVPTRIAAQILLAQALAYAKARNMEGFLTAFTKGVQLAKELGSEKRKQEAIEALKEALEQWPNDQRITGLWELL